MKDVSFSAKAWRQLKKLKRERQTLYVKRIWELIQDIKVNGNMVGMGSPERLYRSEEYKGQYSRKIEIDGKDTFNRLVYSSDENSIFIFECMEHYGQKIKLKE